MISSVLAVALLLLAPADVASLRRAFSSCLASHARSSAEEKMEPGQFDASLATTCTAEQQAFRQAVVASDTARGISRKTSEQGVADEIADYLSEAKERFRDALGSASQNQ